LNFAGEGEPLKQASPVKVILTGLTDHANQIVRFRFGIFQNRVQFSDFQ